MNTGILGIGTGELIVILIIAVLVVGPEKMVEFATKLGMWVAKFRNMSNSATKEFRDALAIDEVKQAFDEVANEVKDIGQELKGAAQDVNSIGKDAVAATHDLQSIASGQTVNNVVQTQVDQTAKELVQPPKPAGRIPQAVIDVVGLPPAMAGSTNAAETGKAGGTDTNDDVNAAPVELQPTTLIEKEEDFKPIEIEDVQVRDQEQEVKESSS